MSKHIIRTGFVLNLAREKGYRKKEEEKYLLYVLFIIDHVQIITLCRFIVGIGRTCMMKITAI